MQTRQGEVHRLVPETDIKPLTRSWGLMLLRGLAGVLFGIAAFVWPGLTVLALTLLYGAFALADGARVFSERLPAGVNPAISPVATADGRLYFANGGVSVVVAAGPKFEILGTSDLGDGSASSPAAAQGRLYLRGARYLYCIGKRGTR